MTSKKHGLSGKPSNRALPDNEKKSVCMQIRCIESDKLRWKQLAELRGMTLSEWVINLANKQKK